MYLHKIKTSGGTVMNNKSRQLTVKKLTSIRGGQMAVVFKQHVEPYHLSKQALKHLDLKPGMKVRLYKGKLFLC